MLEVNQLWGSPSAIGLPVGAILSRDINQGSSQEEMEHTHWVIWEEFNKGTTYKGCRDTIGKGVVYQASNSQANWEILKPEEIKEEQLHEPGKH